MNITELAQNPTRYGTNSQGVFTNQTDGAYVSYLDFVSLVEALEKAQAATTQQGNIASALLDEVTQLRRHADEKAPELRALLIEADSELEVLRQRIAGLESRTVKLTDINEYLAEVHDKTLNRAFRLLAEGVRAGDVAAMRAAGIKVEAE